MRLPKRPEHAIHVFGLRGVTFNHTLRQFLGWFLTI